MYSVLLLNCSMYARLGDSYQDLNFNSGNSKLKRNFFIKEDRGLN
jgi:hypothetical protein